MYNVLRVSVAKHPDARGVLWHIKRATVFGKGYSNLLTLAVDSYAFLRVRSEGYFMN